MRLFFFNNISTIAWS